MASADEMADRMCLMRVLARRAPGGPLQGRARRGAGPQRSRLDLKRLDSATQVTWTKVMWARRMPELAETVCRPEPTPNCVAAAGGERILSRCLPDRDQAGPGRGDLVDLGWVTWWPWSWPPPSCWPGGGRSGRGRSPGGSADRPGAQACLVLPAPVGRGHDHRRGRPVVSGPDLAAGARQGRRYRYADRVMVRLVSGQWAADFADCAEPGARVRRDAVPGPVGPARRGCWSSSAATPWPPFVPAQPIPANPDLKALPVGQREDGLPWLVRLHGTHVLIAGATGAGKARAVGPGPGHVSAHATGLVKVLAADPKLMELA